jgi:uncharacterized protein (DUF1330 family)
MTAPHRIVVIEFPPLDRAHGWYDSPEYRTALAALGDAARRHMLFVDGLPDEPSVS